MMGAFSLKAIGGVTAKVIQVSNGAAVKDFYADRTGRLLDVPVTGQTLRRWLGGATGQVTTWYDQSGRGNHMSCSHEDERPTVVLGDDGNNYIQSGPSYTPFDISANPTSGPVPYSNTKGFTVIWHHNTLGNNTDVCSCTDSVLAKTTRFGTFYGIYTSTFPDGSTASSVYRATGDTVTCTFDGTDRRMYTNGVLNSTLESTWTQSASTAHTIGSAGSNCRLYSVVMFDSVLSDADRTLVENVPALQTPSQVTNFVGSNQTETTIDLTWDASPLATGYIVVCVNTGVPQTIEGATSATFIDLSYDTEYTFTITPSNAAGNGPPTTSAPISTLLPLPGDAPTMATDPAIVTATTMNLAWNEYVPAYATSFNVYAYSVLDGLIGFVNVPISSFSCTYTGLQPDTEYYFAVAGVNATGAGPQNGSPTTNTYTLSSPPYYRTYTGTIETISLAPGTYNFEMAGGSGPTYNFGAGQPSGARSYGTFGYTVTSPITIQYAVGQASPGEVGGGGGTFVYDVTNSQFLFVAGGAGGGYPSSSPYDTGTGTPIDPGDGSGGAAGSGGGSGAGVNSNGSDSTVSAGSGGLTFGNGATGGAGGSENEPQPGGFGGGGGGTRVYDVDLPFGYAYYPGGGGGYTGGTSTATYVPGTLAYFNSTAGTSYMISGSTFVFWQASADGPSQDGYLNIVIP